MIVLAERPTPRLLAWAGELLRAERPDVMRGATLALQNMRSVGGLATADWLALVPCFLRRTLTPTYRADTSSRASSRPCPRTPATAIKAGLAERLEHVPGPVAGPATRRNRHYEYSSELAAHACADARAARAATAGAAAVRAPLRLPRHPLGHLVVPVAGLPVAEAVHPLLVDGRGLRSGPGHAGGRARGATLVQTGPRVPDVQDGWTTPRTSCSRWRAVLLGQAGRPAARGGSGGGAGRRRAAGCVGRSTRPAWPGTRGSRRSGPTPRGRPRCGPSRPGGCRDGRVTARGGGGGYARGCQRRSRGGLAAAAPRRRSARRWR